MESETIKIKIEEKICWITLNRPNKLNSITINMHEKLRNVFDRLDGNVKCVVIRGEGKRAFSAGADITEIEKLTSKSAVEYSKNGHKTILKILTYPKPVVAVIQGYALGGGFELALSCDYRIATEKSRFSFPEPGLGLIPGWGGATLLSRLIGLSKSKELLMTGQHINANTAYNLGIVDMIVSEESLDEDIKVFVKPFTYGAAQPLHELKKLLLDLETVKKKLNEESKAFGSLFKTDDYLEGLSAFKEKRKPEFE